MAEGINKKQQNQKKLNSAYYKNQFMRTEKNKTKKIVRHAKSNPTDEQAGAYLRAKGYKIETIPLTAKGRKVMRRLASG